MQTLKGTYSSYLYGFQGQEQDIELKGQGNSINYKFRMHDPRIGRFFAVDPLASKYPHNSPYAFSENRVIDGVELEGLEVFSVHGDARIVVSYVTLSTSVGVMFDSEGVAFFNTSGGGPAFGKVVTGGVTGSISGAERLEELAGWGWSLGGFASGNGFSAEFSVEGDMDGNFGGVTAGGGKAKPGRGLAIYSEVNYTYIGSKYTYGEDARSALGEDASTSEVNALGKKMFDRFKNAATTSMLTEINSLKTELGGIDGQIEMLQMQQGITDEMGAGADYGYVQGQIHFLQQKKVSLSNEINELTQKVATLECTEYQSE